MSAGDVFWFLLCVCGFSPISPAMVENPCTWDNYGWGLTYQGVPHDCTRYLKCHALRKNIMQCRFGLLWDDPVKACLPSMEVKCGLFICANQSNGDKIPYDLYCNSYWECQGGIPQAMCCAENTTFNGSACVSGVCGDPCPIAPASPYPSKDEYNDSDVNVNVNVTTPKSGCPTLVDIYYDNTTTTFIDNSSKKAWIAVNSVTLGAEPVFSGSSSLVVFNQAHATYGESLEISLVFSVTTATVLTNQILLQSGLCSEEPSFMVTVSDGVVKSLMDVSLVLRTETDVAINSTLTVPKNLRARLEVRYPTASDTEGWSFSILHDKYGRIISRDFGPVPFAESIPRKQGALQIGSGDCSGANGFTGFTGSVYKAIIRSCGIWR